MNTKRSPIEVTGATVEEAIATGLQQLNLPRESVEVEILDEGTRGLFGLGARDATVLLTPQADAAPPISIVDTPVQSTPLAIEPAIEEETEPDSTESLPEEEPFETDEIGEAGGDDDTDYLLSVARETVAELIEKMNIAAEVSAKYAPQDDERSNRPSILVEINGEDLSILIGRQAETLNALQYIVRLIIGKELNQGIDLSIDVQGYRARRAEQLRRIARQMAEQAVRTGKRQYLEPMAANDRRLIHIELRKNPQVETESIGTGDRRKVTIFPK